MTSFYWTKAKRSLILSVILFFVISSSIQAATKTFTRDYSYQASEYDSKVTCRILALKQVERLLLEEVGIYLESKTEVKNFQLTKDEITILTGGIVKTLIRDEKWNGSTYWVQAKMEVDPEDVAKKIDALSKDHQKTKELQDLRKKSDELLKENENLKKALRTGDRDKKLIEKYKKNILEIEATSLINQGWQLVGAGQDEKALEIFDKVLQENVSQEMNAIAYEGKGYAFYRLEKYNEAIIAFTKAIENQQDEASKSRNYSIRGRTFLNLNKNKEAIRDYDMAIKIAPRLLDFYNRGGAYLNLGDHKKAIDDYTMVIKSDPKYTNAYLYRGSSYQYLRKYALALDDFNTALSIDPKNSEAYYQRAAYYSVVNNHNMAIEDSSRAIEIDPKKFEYYIIRGVTFGKLGDYKRAIQDYNRAIDLNPNDEHAYVGRGMTNLYLEQPNEAIKDFNNALKLSPDFDQAHHCRGSAYFMLGNYEAAIRDYSKAIELNPKYIEAYKFRAGAYKKIGNLQKEDEDLQTVKKLEKERDQEYAKWEFNDLLQEAQNAVTMKKYKDAIDLFNKAAQLNQNNSFVYQGLYTAYGYLGNHIQAVIEINKAIKLRPNDADLYSFRAASYVFSSKYDEAIQDCNIAISLNPNLTFAYTTRGQANFGKGNLTEAEGDFIKCCKLGSKFCCDRAEEIRKKSGTVGTDTRLSGMQNTDRGKQAPLIASSAPKTQKAPTQTFTSPTIRAKFVLIPAGMFIMGSPYNEPGREEGEDQREVSIDRQFYMQTTEVTQGQWERIIHRNASLFQKCGEDCPVERVTRDDIEEFIKKLNAEELTDKYRLPTEAEWEYAARAGSATPFYTGSCLSTDQANYDGQLPSPPCPKGKYRKTTTPVGSFSPNAWGLYDMLGNVYELVQDHGVARGGSWEVPAKMCRSASRLAVSPDARLEYIGFRLVRTTD